jgi:hypothetical protein
VIIYQRLGWHSPAWPAWPLREAFFMSRESSMVFKITYAVLAAVIGLAGGVLMLIVGALAFLALLASAGVAIVLDKLEGDKAPNYGPEPENSGDLSNF